MTLRYYSSQALDTTLSSSVTSGATTITVSATTGWPITYPFTLALDYGSALEELVDVTAVSGLNATVTRGIDSSTAVAHGVGATVRHVIIARDIREANAHINSALGLHGITSVNAQTGTSYTPVATDAGTFITLNNANAITLTVPPSVFSVGQQINIQQIGAGQVTVNAGTGVTITGTGTATRNQYSAATILCIGTNTFTLIGDIA
jgi:hypothetical protein